MHKHLESVNLLAETGVVPATKAANLQKEANELLAVFSASLLPAKRFSMIQSPDDSMIQFS
jgi:hypothetical protein